ncbi:MAG: PhoH family protein [Bacteroidales bacterium]|nr:PhoH family protein [Bacteroidales bacterium]
MSEKLINIESYNLVEIFGVNDKYIDKIKLLFPKLKFIVRGSRIKLVGDDADMDEFIKKFDLLLLTHDKFGRITDSDIEQIMEADADVSVEEVPVGRDVLVHGRNGMLIKARTVNQQRMADACRKKDLIFAVGPAGSGKTYTAVALAVRALKNKEVKRIVLTRPAVEAGENLGFLPGDLKEKLDPYLQPLYDALRDMLPPQKLLSYMEDGTIEIAPLAFMRGRTLENAFVILDEAQNTSPSQLKMFLTRMGQNAKFIVTGDVTQIDLPRRQPSGLIYATKILKEVSEIEFIFLNEKDIVRNKIVVKIVRAFDKAKEMEDRKENNNN